VAHFSCRRQQQHWAGYLAGNCWSPPAAKVIPSRAQTVETHCAVKRLLILSGPRVVSSLCILCTSNKEAGAAHQAMTSAGLVRKKTSPRVRTRQVRSLGHLSELPLNSRLRTVLDDIRWCMIHIQPYIALLCACALWSTADSLRAHALH
jgi:hypothetical protein